nr:MAG TPA: Single strand binding protein [Caudoviricetes sp.]
MELCINRVMLLGKVGRDPKVFITKKGSTMANFSVQCVERYQWNSEWHERSVFIPCVAFGKTAELIGNSCKAGSDIFVEGKINVRSYEQNGENKWVTEVNVDRAEVGVMAQQPQASNSQWGGFGSQPPKGNFGQFGEEVSQESIPF